MPKTIQALFALLLLLVASCNRLSSSAPVVPTAGGQRVNGREFLIAKQPESAGYGLYSYVLLGSPPTAESRERYTQVVRAYLRISSVEGLKGQVEPWQLNVTLVPLTETPPAALDLASNQPRSDAEVDTGVEWILAHYDYARAAVLLSRLPGSHSSGPYLVSSLTPLSRGSVSENYLWQDLSAVNASLASLWLTEFMKQAAKERYWERSALQQWALELRDGITTAAKLLPDVQNGIKHLPGWLTFVGS